MHRSLRNHGAAAVAPKNAEPKELEEPVEKAEAAPEVLVASDPAPESGRRAGTSRRTVKEIVADYQAEMERRKAARSAPMIMGAPPPELNIDVATDVLRIAGRRAATLSLGKAEGVTYTGIFIDNNLLDPDQQPNVTIGGFDNGVAGTGSIVGLQGSEINIVAFQELGNTTPGNINLLGNVSVNGTGGLAGASYLEAWGTAASVNNGIAVPFTNQGATTGTVSLVSNQQFSIPAVYWGTYEVTWRVAVSGVAGGTFALRLISGRLGSPDNLTGANDIPRTAVGAVPGAGNSCTLYGQSLLTVPSTATVPTVFELYNSGSGVATLYALTGISVSMVIRRVSQ